jgi:hypothetical protein
VNRAGSIEALLRKANADFADLKTAYNTSLHEKAVREDLKIAIKNIFENLRSCLDYLAQNIFEAHCSGSDKPARLYFPIRATEGEFRQALSRDYPKLQASSTHVVDVLEAVQPYRDGWLGSFNKLNNHNKHQDLVEQTRAETKRVTVSRGGASVSWGPGVTFGSGVNVIGVPIDPRTQMPVPNSVLKTEVVIWVDFRFKETNESVLPFIEVSLCKVEKIFQDLRPYI